MLHWKVERRVLRLECYAVMRKEGLEPSPQRDMILSHARLPIPPLPQGAEQEEIIDLWQKAYKGRIQLQLDT